MLDVSFLNQFDLHTTKHLFFKWRFISNLLNSLKAPQPISNFAPSESSHIAGSFYPGEENIEDESSLKITVKDSKQNKRILWKSSVLTSIKNNQAFLDVNKVYLSLLLEKWRTRANFHEEEDRKRSKKSFLERNWEGSGLVELKFLQVIVREVTLLKTSLLPPPSPLFPPSSLPFYLSPSFSSLLPHFF